MLDTKRLRKQWSEYRGRFNAEYRKFYKKDYGQAVNETDSDIDHHAAMAMQVGDLIREIERLSDIIQENNLPLNPCVDCRKEEANPGLDRCGECYHKRIWESD